MNIPFFSVIIPTYNRAGFLSIALDSVRRQTFTDFELLIIDDGSTDKTQTFCNSIADKRLRYIYQPHKGVAPARNKGITEARGKHICFLDSDDRFCSDKLEVTFTYIIKYPGCKIFHTEELWYRNGRVLSPKKCHKKPDGYVFENALKICCISPSCACIHKDVFARAGLFDEKLKACEDYEFWLRATSVYPVKLIPSILTIKEGGHSDQLSKKYPAMDELRIYAIEKILKSSTLQPHSVRAALAELKKKCKIYIQGAQKRGRLKEASYYTHLMEAADKYVG